MSRDSIEVPFNASATGGLVVITHAGCVITLSPDAADESLSMLTLAICEAVGQRQPKSGGSQSS
jgi:hypothetical protein